MMAEANKGVADKKKWKPPAGYKSAIAKARDAIKAAANKSGKMNAINPGDDTASENEDDDLDTFSQAGSFKLCALTPVRRGIPMSRAIAPAQSSGPINAVNRFAGLEDDKQEYSVETLAALNEWAHKVNTAGSHKVTQRQRREKPTVEEQ